MNVRSTNVGNSGESIAFNEYQKTHNISVSAQTSTENKHLKFALAKSPKQIQKFLENTISWILANRKKIDSLIDFSNFENNVRATTDTKVSHIEKMASSLETEGIKCKTRASALQERIDELKADNQYFEFLISAIKDSVANITCSKCGKPATWKIETPVKSNIHSIENKRKEKEETKEKLEVEKKKLELKIKELYKKISSLKKAVKFDSLTKAYSPCYYHNKLPNVINKCLARKTPFKFVLIDVNSFKDINDTHGHNIGDKALSTLVQAFYKHEEFQPNKLDAIIRRSWDEFIYMTIRNQEETVKMLTSVQKRLNKINLKWENDAQVKISFSSGIVSSDEADLMEDINASQLPAIDIIAKLADERMYKNKKARK